MLGHLANHGLVLITNLLAIPICGEHLHATIRLRQAAHAKGALLMPTHTAERAFPRDVIAVLNLLHGVVMFTTIVLLTNII